MVADMELKERDGVGVDITREGMIIELEPSGNIEVMETIDVLLNTLLGAIVEGVLIILVGGLVSFSERREGIYRLNC